VPLNAALVSLLLALAQTEGPAPVSAPMEAPAPVSMVAGVVRIDGAETNARAVVSLQAVDRSGTVSNPPAPGEPVQIEQKGFRFVPSLVAIQVGTTVRFVNEDPEPHDVYSPEGRYNLGVWPSGEWRDFAFRKPGVYRQLSSIHPGMLGWIVVLETPFFAVSDEEGRFEIREVPPGCYRLAVWHEAKDGLTREVVVEGPGPLELELVVEK
jgi:plastocyanin